MRKRMVIVEDSSDMQFLYRTIFRKSADLEIAAQFATAEEAIERLASLSADLVIVDISLPGMSGIDLIKVVRSKYPRMWILVVTGHDRHRYLKNATEAGADKVIEKGDTRLLLKTVRDMITGE